MPTNRTLFKKGERRVGRTKGVPNKRTREVAEVLETAASKISGVNRLVAWIKERPENEYTFWSSMYMRLLPVQISGQGPRGAIELNVTIDADELGKRLEERGLPAVVFGADKPVLELEAPQAQLEQGTQRNDLFQAGSKLPDADPGKLMAEPGRARAGAEPDVPSNCVTAHTIPDA
jgi:hypothetical protein